MWIYPPLSGAYIHTITGVRRMTGDLAGMLGGLRAFAIPMPVKFRGITVREGALIEGPAGWGEFSPFAEYGPKESARWLASAIESATRESAGARSGRIPGT